MSPASTCRGWREWEDPLSCGQHWPSSFTMTSVSMSSCVCTCMMEALLPTLSQSEGAWGQYSGHGFGTRATLGKEGLPKNLGMRLPRGLAGCWSQSYTLTL